MLSRLMLFRLMLSTLIAVTLVAAGPAPAAETETETFVLERLNGTHRDLGGGVSEIQNGPVTVRPSSPSNRFELLGNRLELTPMGDGLHQADFWVKFEGEADVEAEILVGPLPGGTLTDEVTVPEQEQTIRSQIRLERQEGDYLITVVDSPKEFDIYVQSRLAAQIVAMCESLTRFTFGSGCDGLDSALSHPNVPMPEKGKQFVLESDQLTEDEQRQLDAYLASSE